MKYAVQITFFLVLLAVGLGIYRDYGISWDEPISRRNGVVTLAYVVEHFPPSRLRDKTSGSVPLNEYADRAYGVAFEAPAVALEAMLGISDKKDVFMFRHLLTFLVAVAGIYAVKSIADRRFSDWRIGLLAALFLVFTPRLFAESFYNSKDVVFMALFAIAMNTMISFVLEPRRKTAVLHALASALAVDVRVMAVILPIATVAILIVRFLKRELPTAATCRALALYLAALAVLIPAMWPWLWSDPIGNFIQAFKDMSHFPWNNEVLYMGSFFHARELPWHYIPVWISITTPLLYLALFLVGVVTTLYQIVSRGTSLWKSDEELQDAVFLGLFALPLMSVILLHSTLYDGWRQMYFVYPAFLLLVIRGWVALWRNDLALTIPKTLLAIVTAVSVVHTAVWMWRAHPFQNVYFNILAGTNLRSRYELDYWGLSNRKALEQILKNDDSEIINVRAASFTELKTSFYMIDAGERRRLRYSDEPKAPYYLVTNYRLVKDPDWKDTKYSREYDLVYQIRIDGEVILSVFRWRGQKAE